MPSHRAPALRRTLPVPDGFVPAIAGDALVPFPTPVARPPSADPRRRTRDGGRVCPACEVPLSRTERDGVGIDVCPRCNGAWLDPGELDDLVARAEARGERRARRATLRSRRRRRAHHLLLGPLG